MGRSVAGETGAAAGRRGTRAVSMADVARLAGVSRQTVSRVVNNQACVVEETRKQLLEAAHKAADTESERLMAEARSRAEAERQEILRDARQQVALLAIAVSEKMLRSQLPDSAAQALLDGRLIDEMQEQQQNKRK